jgi:hypothetical protein
LFGQSFSAIGVVFFRIRLLFAHPRQQLRLCLLSIDFFTVLLHRKLLKLFLRLDEVRAHFTAKYFVVAVVEQCQLFRRECLVEELFCTVSIVYLHESFELFLLRKELDLDGAWLMPRLSRLWDHSFYTSLKHGHFNLLGAHGLHVQLEDEWQLLLVRLFVNDPLEEVQTPVVELAVEGVGVSQHSSWLATLGDGRHVVKRLVLSSALVCAFLHRSVVADRILPWIRTCLSIVVGLSILGVT